MNITTMKNEQPNNNQIMDLESGSDRYHPGGPSLCGCLGGCTCLSRKHKGSASEHECSTESTHQSSPSTSSNAAEEGEARSAIETRCINRLRLLTLVLLLSIPTLASVGVYRYTSYTEQSAFEAQFLHDTNRIIERFHLTIESKLTAVHSLSDRITSHGLATGAKFPMVTLPHFALHGGNVRIQSDTTIVKFMPLVTDEIRDEWEAYALQNRHLYDEDYHLGVALRYQQDSQYNINLTYVETGPKYDENDTMIDDGTYYHPHIFNNGATTPRGDAPIGSGPYLPLWQKSPINTKRQSTLNNNFANSKTMKGVLEPLLQTEQAILHKASLTRKGNELAKTETIQISQYREHSFEYLDDPGTSLAYPVFDSLNHSTRQVTGIVSALIYWRLAFTNLFQDDDEAQGYICVISNSYDQTFSYRIDGPNAIYLGEGDPHEPAFDYLAQEADINNYIETRASVQTRSFTQVPLNRDIGKYRLSIYPSSETYTMSNTPWVYTCVILVVFVLTTVILWALDRVVARRQSIVMGSLLKSAQDSIDYERDLNEFMAHEVRNPVAAAMSAHSLALSAVTEISTTKHSPDVETIVSLQEDIGVVGNSLNFIDEFLRSILDIHASAANKLEVKMSPTELYKDCLEPVKSILYKRQALVDVQVECPKDLVVMTDCLRLKQVMINLGRNSIKFTQRGFVRFHVVVVNGFIEISVEDSGPGIPVDKRYNLFQKFQSSLDVLSQGTGIGLALCDNLVRLLKGRIYLDEDYDSGVPGFPGSRFVIQLNQHCLPADAILRSASSVSKSTVTRGNCNESQQDKSLSSNVQCTTNTINGAPLSLIDCRVKEEDEEPNEGLTLPECVSVLFVDDDNILRRLFSRAVKKLAPAWQISEAACGEAALQRFESGETFDLVFMDQYMASTEKQLLGTETVRELRRRGVVSAICGLSANDMAESFAKAGADAFLLKPLPISKAALERELIRICHIRHVANNGVEAVPGEDSSCATTGTPASTTSSDSGDNLISPPVNKTAPVEVASS